MSLPEPTEDDRFLQAVVQSLSHGIEGISLVCESHCPYLHQFFGGGDDVFRRSMSEEHIMYGTEAWKTRH